MGSPPTCDPTEGDPNCHPGRKAPQTVLGLTEVTAVAAGGEHGCALVAGGAAYCWGDNRYGQLGDGTTTWTRAPVAVVGP
jgi:alpha-tubulin suppressor-like RCC1 family protein